MWKCTLGSVRYQSAVSLSPQIMDCPKPTTMTSHWFYVQRVWSSVGLKLHLSNTFKFSKDPHFEENLNDVMGLYYNHLKVRWYFVLIKKFDSGTGSYPAWIADKERPCGNA
jgi:hypothetical protein